MKSILLTLLLLSPLSYANTTIVLGGLSYHIGERGYESRDAQDNIVMKDYNEVNPTMGLCSDDLCLVVSELSYKNIGVALYNNWLLYEAKYVDASIR